MNWYCIENLSWGNILPTKIVKTTKWKATIFWLIILCTPPLINTLHGGFGIIYEIYLREYLCCSNSYSNVHKFCGNSQDLEINSKLQLLSHKKKLFKLFIFIYVFLLCIFFLIKPKGMKKSIYFPDQLCLKLPETTNMG